MSESPIDPNGDPTLRALAELRPRARAVFAASCVQRMCALFLRLSPRDRGDSASTFERLLSALWKDLALEESCALDIAAMIASCDELVAAVSDAAESTADMIREDAVAALCYALRCRASGGVQEARWAAQRATDAIDAFIVNVMGITPDGKSSEAKILEQGVMDSELAREQRDISRLRACESDEDIARCATELRDIARGEGSSFLPFF